ncbi:MAG: hypothetical protein ACODAU_02295 [Myxococcota bacterium]
MVTTLRGGWGLAVLLGLALTACRGGGGSEDAGRDAPMVPPELVVGAGETGFRALENGDDVILHMGIQGGWHVFGAVRGFGVDPSGAELSYALRDPETGQVLTRPITRILGEDQVLWVDEHWERFGDAVIIRGVDSEVLGRLLDLEATLAPAEGAVLTDSRTVRIVEPDGGMDAGTPPTDAGAGDGGPASPDAAPAEGGVDGG